MVKFQIRSEGCRAVSGRAVSPIRFFDPILNNALALRASLNRKFVAHKPAGSPHLRASQGLLPGAPPKRGATYQSYLERPTKPTSRGAGGTYIHTETTTRLHETQAQAGSPNKGNSTVETPTDRGKRVKM